MMDKIEYELDRIATALENIHEQLEIINSPEADKEFNKWYYVHKQKIDNQKTLIRFYKERGDLDRIKRAEEELKRLEDELFEG